MKQVAAGMKRIIALLLMIAICVPSVSAGEGNGAANQRNLVLNVKFDEPTDDGQISGRITVLYDQGDSSEHQAQNVKVIIQTHEKIQFLDMTAPFGVRQQKKDTLLVNLYHINSGNEAGITFRLEYRPGNENIHPQLDADGEVIRPWMTVTVESDNYETIEYSCDLDIEPVARAVCIGWNIKEFCIGDIHIPDKSPAIKNDIYMLSNVFANCFYNGKKVETELPLYNRQWMSVANYLRSDITDKADRNDITYFYVNAHGYNLSRDNIQVCNDGEGVSRPVNNQGIVTRAVNAISYGELLSSLSASKGRAVILLDSCYSGNAIKYARALMDEQRMVIITSANEVLQAGAYDQYGWFANDLAKIARVDAYPDWISTLGSNFDDLFQHYIMKQDLQQLEDIIGTDACATAGDIYLQETKRSIEIENDIPILKNYIGLCPMHFGNLSLPVFVRSEDYDDHKIIIAVKNEKYVLYPKIVFSYDPNDEYGDVIMYMLNGERQLVFEASDNPDLCLYRARLNTFGYDYYHVSLEESCGMATRLCVQSLKKNLILAQYDVAINGADENDGACQSYYTIYRADSKKGLEAVLSGHMFSTYEIVDDGIVRPYRVEYAADNQVCDMKSFLTAFEKYDVAFTDDWLLVEDHLYKNKEVYQVFQRAYSKEGKILLADMRNNEYEELPPTYDELVREYGLGEMKQDQEQE